MTGWGWPSDARKAHYFDGQGRALCDRWFWPPWQPFGMAPAGVPRCVKCSRLSDRRSPLAAPIGGGYTPTEETA